MLTYKLLGTFSGWHIVSMPQGEFDEPELRVMRGDGGVCRVRGKIIMCFDGSRPLCLSGAEYARFIDVVSRLNKRG